MPQFHVHYRHCRQHHGHYHNNGYNHYGDNTLTITRPLLACAFERQIDNNQCVCVCVWVRLVCASASALMPFSFSDLGLYYICLDLVL